VITMREQVDRTTAVQRIAVMMLTVFGGLALLLAAIGLYGVLSYSVLQREREIGIRIAVGASQQRVVLMVLRHAARISAIGVSIGLLITLGISRALTVGLGLPAFNFTLLSLVLFGLLLTSLLAAAVPARKASRINPWLALRQD